MATVKQPTINPTNKLTAATIVAAAVPLAGLIVRNLWPSWYDETVWAGMTPILVMAIGYFVKDEANR